jgi:hypothetical protein
LPFLPPAPGRILGLGHKMNLNLKYVSFRGPPADDPKTLARLPADDRYLLGEANGFVMIDGSLHVRRACLQPPWHSLRVAWEGEFALHSLYPAIRPEDVAFGQDCMGDPCMP